MTTAPEELPRARQLRLLDGFDFVDNGVRITLPLCTQRLTAFLAFHERPLLRTYVAGCLWLDKPSERAYANLRSTLWRLRQVADGAVECRGDHLMLSPRIDVDLRHVARLARQPFDDGFAETTDVLLAGDLLPDWYDDWVIVERERLRQLRLHALESHCRALTGAGRYGEAIDVGIAAVIADPLRESSHRVLIAAHLAEGNAAEAARQYIKFRNLAWEGLGIEPSSAMTELLSGAVDLDLVNGWTSALA